MQNICLRLVVWILIAACFVYAETGSTELWESTRVLRRQQHYRSGSALYPYRAHAEMILRELDLRDNDVVVDIGAGDGWWSERMAQHVGEKGIIYASEVEEEKVKELKEKFAEVVQIKPRLDKTDGIDLLENSCDLAFLSMVYHHFDKGGKVDYLKHLHKIVKPMGRIVVIETYSEISTENKEHGTSLSRLAEQAEQAGWILVRYQLITKSYHYIAIFVQRELFPPERSR